MVLWELALGTAYFLGLRRTYRLALKTQRRIISPRHPKTRLFLHRRTHQIFNMALRVHKNIQQRDIEIGRSLGTWILRWLDRMKPSAQILAPKNTEPSFDKAKRLLELTRLRAHLTSQTPPKSKVDRVLFTSLKNLRPKLFPTGTVMIRPPRLTGTTTQFRNYSAGEPCLIKPMYTGGGGFDSVIRKDILQWMVQR